MLRKCILFVLTVCYSCSSQENNSQIKLEYDYTLTAYSKKAFDLDSLTPFKSENYQVFKHQNREFIALQNTNKNSIQIYSLDSSLLFKEIIIPKEGPNSIAQIDGFTIINEDSIFIYSQYNLRNFILTDMNGKFINKFTATIDGENTAIINHASRTRMPDIYHNGKLYFLIIPNKDFSNPNIFDSSTKLELEYNLSTAKTSFKNVIYPSTYHNAIWGMSHAIPCRIINNKGEFIYSFGIDHLIYVYANEFKETKTYKANSDFIKEIKPFDKKLESNANKDYFIETPYYGEILYDPCRKVYYRFARQGIPINDDEGQVNIWENKPCSVIILNENFKKIGEYPLVPTKNYYPRDSFVAKEGLYISNNHPKHPNIDENKLVFIIFKLIQKK